MNFPFSLSPPFRAYDRPRGGAGHDPWVLLWPVEGSNLEIAEIGVNCSIYYYGDRCQITHI